MSRLKTPGGRWFLVAALLTGVLLGLSACGGGSDEKTDTTVVTLPADDPNVAAAQHEAQTGWNAFVASFRADKPGLVHDVKVGLPTSAGNREHVWVEVTSIQGTTVKGTLANDPVADLGLKFGDKVSVKRSDVEDWAVFRGNDVVLGGFSIAASKAAQGSQTTTAG